MSERTPASGNLVIAAFFLTMSSAFGQTYFIGVFAPALKGEMDLTDGTFGLFYTFGTLASAGVLMWAGKLADRYPIRRLAVVVLLGLAGVCTVAAGLESAWLLLPVLFGLRLFGQGWLGHLAITGVARWYAHRRGRMMSFAVLGFPAGEAIMPFAAVTLIGAVGWRQTWLFAAASLCLISLPLVLFFLRREPPPELTGSGGDARAGDQRHWTRGEVLRRPEFFGVLSGVAAPSFVMTAIIFHQAYLVDLKGWSLAWFVGWFPVYAGVSVVTALATGWLVDRVGSRRILPFFLLPMTVGVLVLTFTDSPYAVPAFMGLGAITSGSASTLLGALWAELFGTRHLGAIRGVAFAALVLASALGPGLVGVLLDAGVRLEHQYLAMAAYALVAALWLKLLVPRLHRLTQL